MVPVLITPTPISLVRESEPLREPQLKYLSHCDNIKRGRINTLWCIRTTRRHGFKASDLVNTTQTDKLAVGFQVLTAVSMKIAVFWVVAPCSLVEVYQRSTGPCCLHHQGDRPTSLHGVTTQKTAIFKLAVICRAVNTSGPH
jgi:hypothetical protein